MDFPLRGLPAGFIHVKSIGSSFSADNIGILSSTKQKQKKKRIELACEIVAVKVSGTFFDIFIARRVYEFGMALPVVFVRSTQTFLPIKYRF
jgi:hypothetical protein